ncbi:MAG: PAS domain S-box protein, partial [Candidatus Obscuribacterales bacterium]|nr:PAS domain S-box protein [Candidatus Obscuribacterales bacterium]
SILWSLLYQSEVEVKKEAYARKVNSSTSLMARHMMDFMVGIVGYGFTRTDTFQGHYESAVKDLPKESDNLIAILKDQPVKQAKAIQVKESFTRALRKADDIRIKLEHDEMDQVMLRLPALHEIAQETSSALHELSSDERLLEKESAEAQERLRESVKICLLIGVGLNVIISLLVLAYFSSSITGRLKVMTENSARLAIGQALNCRVGGNDELSELDRAFHDMAASIIALTRRERALVEQAQDVICSLNEDGKFVSVNAAALDLWGYEPDELLGARVGKLLTADDHDLFVVALKDQQNNGTGFPLETRLRRKNGTMGDCLWSAQWSSDEASFVCISHDITERKRNEHLLKLAESRARSIIENIPIGLAICGTNG